MNGVGWGILLVLVVILIGGFFAGAEMALVSLREGQVRALSQAGQARPAGGPAGPGPQPVPVRRPDRRDAGHPAVRRLRRRPAGRQAQDAAVPADAARRGHGGLAHRRHAGDLVLHPDLRRAGAQAAGPAAVRAGVRWPPPRSLDRLALVATPVVWLLSRCTNLVVRLVGGDPRGRARGDDRRGTARPGGRATRRSAPTSGTSWARSSTPGSGRSARCSCPGRRSSSCPRSCR